MDIFGLMMSNSMIAWVFVGVWVLQTTIKLYLATTDTPDPTTTKGKFYKFLEKLVLVLGKVKQIPGVVQDLQTIKTQIATGNVDAAALDTLVTSAISKIEQA